MSGGWNCDKNSKSREASVDLDDALDIVSLFDFVPQKGVRYMERQKIQRADIKRGRELSASRLSPYRGC